MKKIFMFAAMASVALASCTKNEPAVTPEQGDAILFNSPVVAPVTKAGTEVEFPHTEFYVYAYYTAVDEDFDGTGSLYLRGREFNKYVVDDVCQYWNATPAAYWPKNGDLTFCAYAPEGVTADATTDASKLVLNYSFDAANQKDVLYSDWILDQVSSMALGNDYNEEGIDLPFHHALSKVQFKAQAGTQAAADNITIKSITLGGVKPEGQLTVPYTNNNVAWVPAGTATTYTVLSAGEEAISTTATAIGSSFMFVPQEVSLSENLIVTYQLTTDGGPLEQQAKISLAETWVKGKSYTYTLVFNLDEIKLAPVVAEDWVDGTAAVLPQI